MTRKEQEKAFLQECRISETFLKRIDDLTCIRPFSKCPIVSKNNKIDCSNSSECPIANIKNKNLKCLSYIKWPVINTLKDSKNDLKLSSNNIAYEPFLAHKGCRYFGRTYCVDGSWVWIGYDLRYEEDRRFHISVELRDFKEITYTKFLKDVFKKLKNFEAIYCEPMRYYYFNFYLDKFLLTQPVNDSIKEIEKEFNEICTIVSKVKN